jgi:hypothetical protein
MSITEISQNLQANFAREFGTSLAELKSQQIQYVRQQTIARLAVTTAAGVLGTSAIVLGIVVFDSSASVLITLIAVVARMSGPATQLQRCAANRACLARSRENP